MDIGNYITIGIVLFGFVANAAYLKGAFGTQIRNNAENIATLQRTVQYKDNCTSISNGLNTRITRIEAKENSKHR